jgi:hypothetical protein
LIDSYLLACSDSSKFALSRCDHARKNQEEKKILFAFCLRSAHATWVLCPHLVATK